MKNTPNYVSTSQAAKMLGLSVGTVQRMVQNGVFKAFITHGGHRRILSDSLNEYCQKQGFPQPSPKTNAPQTLLCILHDSQHSHKTLDTLAQWEHIQVITNPLDLMEIEHDVGIFFIDARIPWVHTSPRYWQNARMQNAHIVIYNSSHMPPDSPLAQAQHLSLFEHDISLDLVYGYLLCTTYAQQGLNPRH